MYNCDNRSVGKRNMMSEIKIAELLVNIGANLVKIDWSKFFTPMFASLAGAGSAFKLNALHEEKKEQNKNLDYLVYSIKNIESLYFYLLQIREQSTRHVDFQKQLNYLEKFVTEEYDKYKNGQIFNKEFEMPLPRCFNTVFLDDFELAINFEKLNFIARTKTQTIGLLVAIKTVLVNTNKTLRDLNNHIEKYSTNNDELAFLKYLDELIIKWKYLDYSLDHFTYIVYLMMLCLVKTGEIMYENFSTTIFSYNKKGFEHLELNYKPKGYEDLEEWTQN